MKFIFPLVKDCGRVLTIEESNVIGGWGSELSSIIHGGMFQGDG